MTEDLKFRLPGSLGLRSVFLLPSQGLWIALGIKYITFQIVSRQFLGFSQFLGQLLLRVFDDSENGLDWLLDFPDEFTLFGHNSPLLCCLRYWKGLPFLILFQPVCPRWSLWWLFRFWASFRIQWIFFSPYSISPSSSARTGFLSSSASSSRYSLSTPAGHWAYDRSHLSACSGAIWFQITFSSAADSFAQLSRLGVWQILGASHAPELGLAWWLRFRLDWRLSCFIFAHRFLNPPGHHCLFAVVV